MPNVTIRKDRISEFSEFLTNDNKIDSISLIESDKLKTTVISLGNQSSFRDVSIIRKYEKI